MGEYPENSPPAMTVSNKEMYLGALFKPSQNLVTLPVSSASNERNL